MQPRKAVINRETTETKISLELCLDGTGSSSVDTGIGFLDHMLTLWSRHGLFDLKLQARGDLEVDAHHTVEDVGLCLGKALKKALSDKRDVTRYGQVLLPMDEALIQVAVDLSGRPYLEWDVELPVSRLGNLETEAIPDFFRAMVTTAAITLHVFLFKGRNTHHIIEAVFKGTGRALRNAVELDPRVQGIPSTKGML